MEKTTKFFTYHQNGSGGHWDHDTQVSQVVIIEAENAEAADRIAMDVGIYFNGVDDDIDCDCCGDRWYPAGQNEATDTPIANINTVNWTTTQDEFSTIVIHFADGTVGYGTTF